MISLHYLSTVEEIKELLKRDNVGKTILSDVDINTWIPAPSNTWLKVVEKNQTIAVMVLTEFVGSYVCFHGGVYKPYRDRTVQIVKDTLEEVRKIQDCIFLCTIAETNIAAIKLVKKLGFIQKTILQDKTKNILVFAEK